jgi:hypothetical protein
MSNFESNMDKDCRFAITSFSPIEISPSSMPIDIAISGVNLGVIEEAIIHTYDNGHLNQKSLGFDKVDDSLIIIRDFQTVSNIVLFIILQESSGAWYPVGPICIHR